MLNELYNNLREDKAFQDLFQPISKEELEVRQKVMLDRILKKGKCTLNPDGTYSCEGIVDFTSMHLTKLLVKFKEVKGEFWCWDNQLTSLEGSPEIVGSDFVCSQNNLTSLKGGPKIVKGYYDCSNNPITSLEGIPKHVGHVFYIRDTPITSEMGDHIFSNLGLDKYR